MLWDINKRQSLGPLLTGPKGFNFSMAFSPDGKTLALGGTEIAIWDVEKGHTTGQSLKAIQRLGNQCVLQSATVKPCASGVGDGKALVAESEGPGMIILWDVDQVQPIGAPLTGHKGHKGWLNSVSFSPDGKTLASGDRDGNLILWDVEQRQANGAPSTGYDERLTSVAFSPDGNTLASGVENWEASSFGMWRNDNVSERH